MKEWKRERRKVSGWVAETRPEQKKHHSPTRHSPPSSPASLSLCLLLMLFLLGPSPCLSHRQALTIDTDQLHLHSKMPAQPPQTDATTADDAARVPPFGHEMLPSFQLQEGFLNLNHGSFGATPIVVRNAQRAYTSEMEARPDDWFRGKYQRLVDTVKARMGADINADPEDLALVENASAGVNAVFRSLDLTSDDTIALLSCAYPMVTHTASFLDSRKRANVDIIPLYFPIQSNASVVDAVREYLTNAEKVPTILAISHIVSVPAVLLPIEEIAALAKKMGVKYVLIDGAHALGQMRIDMRAYEKSGIDFYTANGHKWLYSPKGSAVLWVSSSLRNAIAPTVISSEYRPADFAADFMYTGTRDYTAFVSMKDAFDFRESIGGDAAIMGYMTNLSHWASDFLVKRWKTEAAAPTSMTPVMASVRLPTSDAAKATGLTSWLIQEHDVQIVMFTMVRPANATSADGGWFIPTNRPSVLFSKVIMKEACDPDVSKTHSQEEDALDGDETIAAKTRGDSATDGAPSHHRRRYGPLFTPEGAETSYWVRLSAQVYIEQADFVRVAELIDQYLAEAPQQTD